MSDLCIETKNLTKRFGQKIALNDFSLNIAKGGIHAIVGSNGAGKSTLFRLLLGMETPTSGHSKLLGAFSCSLSSKERGRIGYVNEEHTLPGWMKVDAVKKLQQSFYPHWNHDIFNQVIEHFDVDPKQKVSALSRGERAGFNLSMSLAQRPTLLILDEPTLGLDVVARQSFLEALMFAETEDEMTTIYCSHQMEEVERVAENLIIMEKGCLTNNSTPEDFCERINYWVADWDVTNDKDKEIPGFLSRRIIEGRQHILTVDQGVNFSGYLQAQGARHIDQLPVNLERAVNAFLTANHKKPAKLLENTSC